MPRSDASLRRSNLPSLLIMEWKPGIPRWTQVYEVIKGRIMDGTYAPGERVPSVLDLTNTYGIANATAQKVLTELKREGLTYSEPGMGTFVTRRPEREEP